jgi:imidazoleglycerol-phosphate dehydratase
MIKRRAEEKRDTKETQISIDFTIDGTGTSTVDTGIPFMDHMLTLFARHGYFDMTVQAKGDLEIDAHHTMEDLGIVLGKTIRKALGDCKGIRRYGFFLLPMDETLTRVVIDLSGRPCLIWKVAPPAAQVNGIDSRLFREFFQALTNALGANVHVDLIRSEEIHHAFESIFKGFARALDAATLPEPRETSVPSTKGILEG